jgi:hypothetical protein
MSNKVHYYTTEDCKTISIKDLSSMGFRWWGDGYRKDIHWRISGSPCGSISIIYNNTPIKTITFDYNITDNIDGSKRLMNYKFYIHTTNCNFGGVRSWFVCGLYHNGIHCGKRVSKLYKAPNSDYFGCRHCMNLTYESRLKNNKGRLGYFIKSFDIQKKKAELAKTITKTTYKGRYTKRYERLLRLEAKESSYIPYFQLFKESYNI